MNSIPRPRVLFALAALSVVGMAAPAKTPLRLEGLDRLYFARVFDAPDAGEAETASLDPAIAALAPPRWADAAVLRRAVMNGPEAGDEFDQITLRDHVLLRAQREPRLVLRELIDARHPRLFRTYWALYAEGQRTDLWSYDPGRAVNEDGKMLGNLSVIGTALLRGGALQLRVHDSYARPGGAWLDKVVELTLQERDGAFKLERVRTVFMLVHGYDGELTAETEELVGDRYRISRVEPKTQAPCGLGPEGPASIEASQRIVRCCLAQGPTSVTYRSIDSRSFIERGVDSDDAGVPPP